MTRVLLNGCLGRMGLAFARVAARGGAVAVTAGVDARVQSEPAPSQRQEHFPVFASLQEAFDGVGGFDVIVDFSSPDALDGLLGIAAPRRLPILLASTGYTEGQKRLIADAAANTPVFFAANLSFGVSLLADLAAKAAAALGESFDVELVERHHGQKVDAPSGTAMMLAEAVSAATRGGLEPVYDRHARRERRGGRELGMHAVRGGTIVGEHTVMFLGNDEAIEIKHAAYSKEVFAEGAVRAAAFVSSVKAPGLYGMADIINGADS